MKVGSKGAVVRSMRSVVVALATFVCVAPVNATILTFDEGRSSGLVVPADIGPVPQDYGDRVTGSPMSVSGGQFTYGNGDEGFTPNVTVQYFLTGTDPFGLTEVQLFPNQTGDLIHFLIGDNFSLTLNIEFVADAGFAVQLHHFDLAACLFCDNTINAVSVLDGGNSLYSKTPVFVLGNNAFPGHSSFDFPTPLTGSNLQIVIDYSNQPGEFQDGYGIDNIRFGQTLAAVPEPSTLPMFLLGLGGFAFWVRRRQRLS